MTTTLVLLTILAAPPIGTPVQAVARLRSAKGTAAVRSAAKDITKACRGKLRHALRDHPALLAETKKIATTRPTEERMAALDLFRCFTPAKMMTMIAPNLSAKDPAMVAYAAEVAARLESGVTVAPLLAQQAKKKAACNAPGLAAADVDVCVWLIYAPGPGLAAADRATRESAGAAAVAMFRSPYAKVREVAVETATASRLKKFASAVGALIKDEKRGAFEQKNDAALLGRFKKRVAALKKGD